MEEEEEEEEGVTEEGKVVVMEEEEEEEEERVEEGKAAHGQTITCFSSSAELFNKIFEEISYLLFPMLWTCVNTASRWSCLL